MHDLAAPFGRHVIGGRRALVRHHRHDFTAEDLLVEFERRLAFALERQIGVELHGLLLLLMLAVDCKVRAFGEDDLTADPDMT